MHQSKYYSKDPHSFIPLDCTFHCTPSGYMDRYGWLKAMTQFSNIYGASPVNNQIIFFSGNDSHFYYYVRIHTNLQNIQLFVLNSGDSSNNHPNYNGTNEKINFPCNGSKVPFMLNYVTMKIIPHHVNLILAEAWVTFKVSTGNIIRYRFPQFSLLNHQHPGIFCLHPSLFCIQG